MEVSRENSNHNDQLQRWKNKAMTGTLPDDFLRIYINPPGHFQQMGFQPQVNYSPISYYQTAQTQGSLKITVAEVLTINT